MAVPLTGTIASDSTEPVFPPLYTADVLACQFSSWYPRFKRNAPKATVVRPLPDDEDLVAFLEADGLFLPEGSGPMGISELSDSEEEEEDSDSDQDEQPPTFSFPRLDAEIRAALAKYDGAVFPKLNWSSPQDAAWMVAGQNMKCQTPADVYLLLKSSDFISHDLDHAFDDCVDHAPPPPGSEVDQTSAHLARLDLAEAAEPESEVSTTRRPRPRERPYSFELVLKKWFDMPRSQEWRCFVRDNHLLGISQRDTTLYDFLQPQDEQDAICDLIEDFWQASIRDQAPLRNYVLDVYITRDRSRVFVIDFNPFSPRTDPLLFSYPELHDLFLAASSSSPDNLLSSSSAPQLETPTLPAIRVVSPTRDPSAGSAVPRYAHNRYPKDVVDMSEGQSIAEFAKEWMNQVGDAAGFGDREPARRDQKQGKEDGVDGDRPQVASAGASGERIGR